MNKAATSMQSLVLLLAWSAGSMVSFGAEEQAASMGRGRVIYNLDCSEFFVGTFGDPVPETIDAFVDAHAAAGVTDLFINVNAQRTNYRSDVWEADWDGYDPDAGDDQPFFAAIDPKRRSGPDAREADMYKNMLALHKSGCDYPKRMLDRAHHNNLSAWISLRMNDAHNPDKPDYPSHSTFWRSHPEWRLSSEPNPARGSWSTGGMDYERPEVRAYYMDLIHEVCSRYDLDGLELDFLRFDLYFRPGREHQGARLMTELVEQTRNVTREAAKRLGHPVKLAVRVPTTPWIARSRGLDAVAWAKAGLVDLIIASPFWDSSDSDIPIETWKGLLIGTDVAVVLCHEDGINSGATGRRTMNPEESRGIMLSGLHRGSDGVYFFNLFTNPYQSWPPAVYYQILRDTGSFEDLAKLPRRHPITIRSPWAPGEPNPSSLLPHEGKNGVFRIHIGPKPLQTQKTRIELAVSGYDEPLDVRLNGVACTPASGVHHIYDAPPDAASEGYNLVEVNATQDVTINEVAIFIH